LWYFPHPTKDQRALTYINIIIMVFVHTIFIGFAAPLKDPQAASPAFIFFIALRSAPLVLQVTGPNRQDPTKQGDLEGKKIDNSGGGLIKTAFARFLERAIAP
jgi:hypothetical protein